MNIYQTTADAIDTAADLLETRGRERHDYLGRDGMCVMAAISSGTERTLKALGWRAGIDDYAEVAALRRRVTAVVAEWAGADSLPAWNARTASDQRVLDTMRLASKRQRMESA